MATRSAKRRKWTTKAIAALTASAPAAIKPPITAEVESPHDIVSETTSTSKDGDPPINSGDDASATFTEDKEVDSLYLGGDVDDNSRSSNNVPMIDFGSAELETVIANCSGLEKTDASPDLESCASDLEPTGLEGLESEAEGTLLEDSNDDMPGVAHPRDFDDDSEGDYIDILTPVEVDSPEVLSATTDRDVLAQSVNATEDYPLAAAPTPSLSPRLQWLRIEGPSVTLRAPGGWVFKISLLTVNRQKRKKHNGN